MVLNHFQCYSGFNWEGNWYGVECRGQDHLPRDVPRVVTNIHLTGLNSPEVKSAYELRTLEPKCANSLAAEWHIYHRYTKNFSWCI